MKELLLGPPPATSRLTGERLGKLLALAVFPKDAMSPTADGFEHIMLIRSPERRLCLLCSRA
jgi:hypothetical protein